MDDNKSPLSTPSAKQPINLPAAPIDLTAPAPKPAMPVQPLETPLQPPIEHDIVSPSSATTEQLIPSPVSDPAPKVSGIPPEAPSTIPSIPTTPSSIPPMPSLDSFAAPVTNPPPTAVPTPTADPVINVSAPAQNSTTPPSVVEAPQTPASPPAASESGNPIAETKIDQTAPPKKSKALVFVVIILALVALILGGLVVWRAMQPATSTIEESMTPPVVTGTEDAEAITEEEVMVEQPDATENWETFQNSLNKYQIRIPEGASVFESGMGRKEASESNSIVVTQTPRSNKPLRFMIEVESIDSNRAQAESLQEYMTWLRDNNINHSSGKSALKSDLEAYELNSMEGYTFSTSGTMAFTPAEEFETENMTHVFAGVEIANRYYIFYYPDIEPYNQISPTFKIILPPTGDSGAALQGSCTQDGKTFADGDEVPAPDSCNSCSCENGQIACTAMACEE